jgi:GT2 family glycosyltransferase
MQKKTEYSIDVSIVIVSMNNLKYLFPCLDSIFVFTNKFKYEILVVAYLFSKENLFHLKEKYPTIKVTESNTIRGFSENNNLALRQSKGKYCFILNDDTTFNMPVIDMLIDSMQKVPDAAIMSPKLLYPDGRLQVCGRPRITIWTYILSLFKMWDECKISSPYTNKNGIFQSYNIIGAAFLIKTNVFEKLGWFDESYFFCPEDIALSTLANEQGYKCYVDTSIILFHHVGKSSSEITPAIIPAIEKGNVIFFAKDSNIIKNILCFMILISSLFKVFYWQLKSISNNQYSKRQIQSYSNVIYSIYSSKTPKEIFIFYYKTIQKGT